VATYTVKQKYLVDNFAVLELLTPAELEVGWGIDVDGVDVTFDGTYTIYSLPQYQIVGVDQQGDLVVDPRFPLANQVCYQLVADNVPRQAAEGTLTWTPATCTWITSQNILDWLGISVATAADQTFTTSCAAAANAFCYRRRYEAGYVDSLTVVPSQDVKLGTIMYGGGLYKARGSVDMFSSYQDMGQTPVAGMNGQIKQLLGIDRPACA